MEELREGIDLILYMEECPHQKIENHILGSEKFTIFTCSRIDNDINVCKSDNYMMIVFPMNDITFIVTLMEEDLIKDMQSIMDKYEVDGKVSPDFVNELIIIEDKDNEEKTENN